GRWWFGSVAEAVVAHSRLPVLLDRAWQPSQRELLLADQPRLLVPLDGSMFAESVLEVAAGLADDLGAELVVVRVDPRPRDVRTAEQAIAEGERTDWRWRSRSIFRMLPSRWVAIGRIYRSYCVAFRAAG